MQGDWENSAQKNIFLPTYLDSCPSANTDPSSILTSKFLMLMIYFWFPLDMEDLAAFSRKNKEFPLIAFCYAAFCRKMLHQLLQGIIAWGTEGNTIL